MTLVLGLWYYLSMTLERLGVLKELVAHAGGNWVGIQEFEEGGQSLVLFNSPTTHSTLALPDDEFFTLQAVRDKIAASDKLFGNDNA